jgi:hypothetical protein
MMSSLITDMSLPPNKFLFQQAHCYFLVSHKIIVSLFSYCYSQFLAPFFVKICLLPSLQDIVLWTTVLYLNLANLS